MRALLKLELTAAELDRVASGFEAVAVAKEADVGKDASLPVVLGGVLMQKIDEGKKGTQEFFRELDANGEYGPRRSHSAPLPHPERAHPFPALCTLHSPSAALHCACDR